jgi:hypothetical protein
MTAATATQDPNYYGSLADYFNNSSGYYSQGKAGGTSGSARQYAAPPPQQQSTAPQTASGSDNTQGGNAQSGANSWISAAVSQTSSDKSAFLTPFSQQFGGISNNQIINSPNATGAVTTSPIAPITSDPSATGGGYAGVGGYANVSPVTLILAIFAGIALLFYVKR